MLRILRFIFILLIILSGLAIHMRNEQAVSFDYYLGSIDLAFSLFLISALITGTALGIVACLPAWLRQKNENRALTARIRIIEKELDNLRIIPTRN